MAVRGGALSPEAERVRALSDRSLTRAARSLGQMLDHSMRFTACELHQEPSSALTSLAGEAERDRLTGLRFRILGQGSGWILLLFPWTAIYRLLQLVMGIPATPHTLTNCSKR